MLITGIRLKCTDNDTKPSCTRPIRTWLTFFRPGFKNDITKKGKHHVKAAIKRNHPEPFEKNLFIHCNNPKYIKPEVS